MCARWTRANANLSLDDVLALQTDKQSLKEEGGGCRFGQNKEYKFGSNLELVVGRYCKYLWGSFCFWILFIACSSRAAPFSSLPSSNVSGFMEHTLWPKYFFTPSSCKRILDEVVDAYRTRWPFRIKDDRQMRTASYPGHLVSLSYLSSYSLTHTFPSIAIIRNKRKITVQRQFHEIVFRSDVENLTLPDDLDGKAIYFLGRVLWVVCYLTRWCDDGSDEDKSNCCFFFFLMNDLTTSQTLSLFLAASLWWWKCFSSPVYFESALFRYLDGR